MGVQEIINYITPGKYLPQLLVWYFLMLLLILLVNYSLQYYICITCLGLGKCGDRELLISSQIICSIKGILGCFSRTWKFQQ